MKPNRDILMDPSVIEIYRDDIFNEVGLMREGGGVVLVAVCVVSISGSCDGDTNDLTVNCSGSLTGGELGFFILNPSHKVCRIRSYPTNKLHSKKFMFML